MGLFDQIINAVDDPHRQASSDQLGNIFDTTKQLGNSYGTDSSTMQSVLSIVGNYVRSALQHKRSLDGNDQAQSFVEQYGGTYPSPQAVHSLFSPNQVEQIATVAAQQTGLNAGIIQQMLPMLVPIVLNLLRSGAPNQYSGGANPVMNAFLDADRDGDVDVADAMQLAGRYLNR